MADTLNRKVLIRQAKQLKEIGNQISKSLTEFSSLGIKHTAQPTVIARLEEAKQKIATATLTIENLADLS